MTETTHKSIREIEEEIIEEFAMFENPMDKYEYLIDIGKQLPEMSEANKTDDNLVKGCQSKVWLHASRNGERVLFEANSNTVITKGIIGLLTRVLSNQKADDILNAKLEFIDKINLRGHLSSQRSNGLTAMIQKMKAFALAL